MVDNVKLWLNALNFKENQEIYELIINSHRIEVDYKNKSIKYPNLKEIGRNTTTNFSSEENFVVLEIIIGLLKQGYLPNQISIEKGYKLGHNTKSGNADVTVEDNEGNPFLIIEAKTFGMEFEKEWKNTLNDGGQLFSYEKQENKAQVLVLYASEVIENKINRIYRAIILKDNESFLSTLENPKGYKNARGGNDKFEIWRDTYQYDYVTNGILESSVKTFEINKVKSSIDDLKVINHEEVQKKYNQFATILRKYNIGGRENAFDKLVNLFLTKIVDEQQNKNNLQFNWKGVANDTYFELVDRLQKLYQVGMEKFLNEKVSYVSEKDVEDSFRLRKDAAKDSILKYFKELKYFSNNDFTFLDVYNEQLFYQNSKVLVEIVQMLQDMKLRTNEQNQFLGDLFEGFLDNGVKQSEGQFFTPLPIVKFIVSSLPIREINENTDIPKVIDYACGAGHFLNEYAEELKQFVEKDKIKDYYKSIFGIEKEYRLSKVAKVSAFMYGQDDINIIYGDGLTEHNQIKNGTFSILIANPPYSVKGFLETLSEKDRAKYELAEDIKSFDTNNSIELFFIERANQLLKSEGISAIILPGPILSNGNLYTKARKMLLEHFEIIAIVEFGSKTFGSTGTNTVTLFLRKKKYPPKEADNYKYAVERWFDGIDVLESDVAILYDYCMHNELDYNVYLEIQKGFLKDIFNIDLFKEYVENFKKSSIYKNILKKKITSKYNQDMKNAEVEKSLLDYIRGIEQEKVYYFALATSQKTKVIVVKTPVDNNEKKLFLGYEWSERKGNEGIKYLGSTLSEDEMEISKNQALNSIKTPLFNPLDLTDNSKINTIIRNNFKGFDFEIPSELASFVSKISLIDMLDFKQINFDSQIKTSVKKEIKIDSKYPIKKLVDFPAKIEKGSSITLKQAVEGDYKVVAGGRDFAYMHNIYNRDENTITISASGNAGYVNFWSEKIFASDCTTVRGETDINTKYIYFYLQSIQDYIFSLARGSAQQHVYPDDIKKILIPVPPISVQEQLVLELEKFEEQYESSKFKIEEYRNKIDEIFKNLEFVREQVMYKLSSKKDFALMIGKRVLKKELKSEGIPVYSANVFEPFGLIDKTLIEDFSQPSILWGIDGDWMVNTISKDTPFYPTDHAGVLRVKNSNINYRYLAYKLKQEGIREGFSRNYRASVRQIKKISITVPDIEIQNKAISEVEKFEALINEENLVIKSIILEKEKIINKYLN